MGYLDAHGVTVLTEEIKRYADATYAKWTEATSESWDNNITYIPVVGEICVWTDYAVVDGKNVPSIKIGDGNAYAVDLPFVSDDIREELFDHVNNKTIHITASERTNWNDKIAADVSGENLVLST